MSLSLFFYALREAAIKEGGGIEAGPGTLRPLEKYEKFDKFQFKLIISVIDNWKIQDYLRNTEIYYFINIFVKIHFFSVYVPLCGQTV